MKLTADILDAIAHRERYLGFYDNFCNQLAGYLIETANWDWVEAMFTVRSLWNIYRKDNQDSLGRLWQYTLTYSPTEEGKKELKEIQAAILHLVNESNDFAYNYFEGGKPLKQRVKKQ